MSAFEYVSLDAKGKEKRGILEGDTARQVRQQLREQGLTPLSVAPITEQKSPTGQIRSRRTIGALDLALITRQTAALLKAGLPLEETLRSVARQSGKAKLESILLAMRSKVREGHSFATALADFPRVFPEIYLKTVHAGESAGHLDIALERLADYTENRHRIRQKVGLALFYPALLTVVAVSIVIALLALVVPQIVSTFSSMEQKPPMLTRGLIVVSDFFQAYWLVIALAAPTAVIGALAFFRRPLPKAALHRVILRLPMIGRLVRTVNAARFSRTLAILMASNVPILDALRVSGQVLSNLPMQKSVEQATIKVREGSSVHSALEQSGHFPPMTLSLIGSGEAGGNLDEMLERAAEIQEREVESFITALLGIFEPVLILFMGGIVLMIVLAMLLPMLQMNLMVR